MRCARSRGRTRAPGRRAASRAPTDDDVDVDVGVGVICDISSATMALLRVRGAVLDAVVERRGCDYDHDV
jgi:hypothetical protein